MEGARRYSGDLSWLMAGGDGMPSLFAGIPVHELAATLRGHERRRFEAGAVLIGEGDLPRRVYLLLSGSADVVVADRDGAEQRVGRVASGEAIGEMALLTGQPASATVRATEAVEAFVIPEADFLRLTDAHPAIYRNFGAILAERLARTNRLVAGIQPGQIVVLESRGGPDVAAYALGASVAWHTRRPTVLAVVGGPSDELAGLAVGDTPDAGVHVIALSESDVAARCAELGARYDHVLLLARDVPGGVQGRRVSLVNGAGVAGRDGDLTIAAWADPTGARPHSDGRVAVPEPASAELDALRAGLLPASGPVGSAVGWAARVLCRLRVGVALGAGSLRGYSHIGVLRELERLGVPVDAIAGASVGAAVSGLYAHLGDLDRVADTLDELGDRMFRPTIPRKSLLSTRSLTRYVRSQLGDASIEELRIPVGIVTADAAAQEEVVLTSGSLALAILASTAVPGVYPALRVGPHTLVDGGVFDPVPAGVAARLGADVVVAVRLVRPAGDLVLEARSERSEGPIPSALGSILRSVDLMQARLPVDSGDAGTILLTPDFEALPSGQRLRSFRSGRRYVEAGERVAAAALVRLAETLPWLRDA